LRRGCAIIQPAKQAEGNSVDVRKEDGKMAVIDNRETVVRDPDPCRWFWSAAVRPCFGFFTPKAKAVSSHRTPE
jgi:hypothetical protein